MNKQDLLKSKSFCILPFAQACVWQDGYVQACCLNDHRLGYTYEQTTKEIFSPNNEKLKDFRKEFFSDKLPDSCQKCRDYENLDSSSYRIDSNRMYGHLLDEMDISSEESLINNEKVFLWDIRLSNLCNLKCLICRGSDSSRLAEEENKYPALYKAFNNPEEFIDFFEEQIDNLREIYFVGGEPLLLVEHYKLLDLLIKHKKFNIRLRYNTNGTTIVLGNRKITDYWKHFTNIDASFSIDAGWEQLEYIRNGAVWTEVLENLKTLKKETPHAKVVLGIVITILNIFHIRKLYEFLVNEKLIQPVHFHLMNVYNKDYYRPTTLPPKLKEKAMQEYQDWKADVENKELDYLEKSQLLHYINFVINLLNSADTSHHLAEFKQKTLYYDKIRGTDFFKTFPELKEIFEDESN